MNAWLAFGLGAWLAGAAGWYLRVAREPASLAHLRQTNRQLEDELDDAYERVFELIGDVAEGRRWARTCEAHRVN